MTREELKDLIREAMDEERGSVAAAFNVLFRDREDGFAGTGGREK